jgi:chromosome segregation ATPase
VAASSADNAAATARADRAEASAGSQEQRAADLKEQLALAHAALARAHDDLEKAHRRSDAAIDALRAELGAAVTSAADAARGLAVAQAQSVNLQETFSATRAHCGVLEQRAVKAEALAAEAQRQVAAMSDAFNPRSKRRGGR